MSRPTDLPDFGTGANYGFGPYAGQPNKSKPSAGVVTEGLNPQAPIPTEWLNWLFNNHGQWIDYLDLVAGGAAFGDASDGNITFDGAATVLGLVPSTGVYTATRDIFARNCTVTGASTVLKMNGFRLFVKGTLTTAAGGSVNADGGAGGNASGSTGGTAGAAPYAGGNTTILQIDPSGYQAGTAGGNSGVGGANIGPMANALGGSGGNGGNGGTGTGGTVSANTAPAAAYGSPRAVTGSVIGFAWGVVTGTLAWRPVYGGSGGCGGGSGTAGAAGGGGGGGGGILGISARVFNLASAGDLHASGGRGGNASTGGDGNSGGGGGGGGGIAILVYSSSNVTFSAAINTPGGAPGTGGGGASAHPGIVGSNGAVLDFGISV